MSRQYPRNLNETFRFIGYGACATAGSESDDNSPHQRSNLIHMSVTTGDYRVFFPCYFYGSAKTRLWDLGVQD